jgi:hypothetical protein
VRAWILFAPVLPVAAAVTAAWVVDLRDWRLPIKTVWSRTVQVRKADRREGEIVVTQGSGEPFTLHLNPHNRLWDSIAEGGRLQARPKVDASGKKTYSLRLQPGARRWRLVSTALIAICVIVAAFNFSVVTWGVQPWSRAIAMALGAPLDSLTCSDAYRILLAFCANRPVDEDWKIVSTLSMIVEDPDCRVRPCTLLVAAAVEEFDASAFTYYVAQDFPESSLAPRRANELVGRGLSLRLERLLDTDYVVYSPLQRGDKCRDGYQTRLATEFFRLPPAVLANAYQEVASLELPHGRGAKVIKRTRPLTSEERELCVEALEVLSP